MHSRFLSLLLVALWVACGAIAHARVIIVPDDDRMVPVLPTSAELAIHVDGPIARSRLTLRFRNPGARALEGNLLVSVPRGTALSELAIVSGKDRLVAAAMDRDEARHIYESIVRKMRDPALLEFIDEETFRVRAFPIPPGGEMPIELEFIQPLTTDAGSFLLELPWTASRSAAGAPPTTVTGDIAWSAPLGLVYSPTHSVDVQWEKDRHAARFTTQFDGGSPVPFALVIAPEVEGEVSAHLLAEPAHRGHEGAFMLLLTPPSSGALAEPLPKTVTILYDISGSMNTANKMEQARSALRQFVGSLSPADSFNIIAFETRLHTFQNAPVPATDDNRAAADEFLAGLRASGSTNLSGALSEALTAPVDGLHHIVLVSDGRPTVGEVQTANLLEMLGRQRPADVRLFVFGVGYDVNARLLDALAAKSRGLADYAVPGEDVERRVSTFCDAVNYPVLSDLELKFDGKVAEVYPVHLPDLFRGRPMIVYGRFTGDRQVRATLTGSAAGEDYRAKWDLDPAGAATEGVAGVELMWANAKLAHILEQIRIVGEDRELRDEAIALGERYNLPTPYTSLLAVDDREMDGVVPGRRDARPATAGANPVTLEQKSDPSSPADQSLNIYRHTEPLVLENYVTTDGAKAPESGEKAVRSSLQLAQRKRADNLAAVPSFDASSAKRRRVADREFVLDGEVWTDQSPHEGFNERRIVYLSGEWMRLYRESPELLPILELGERVSFAHNKVWIVITP